MYRNTNNASFEFEAQDSKLETQIIHTLVYEWTFVYFFSFYYSFLQFSSLRMHYLRLQFWRRIYCAEMKKKFIRKMYKYIKMHKRTLLYIFHNSLMYEWTCILYFSLFRKFPSLKIHHLLCIVCFHLKMESRWNGENCLIY